MTSKLLGKLLRQWRVSVQKEMGHIIQQQTWTEISFNTAVLNLFFSMLYRKGYNRDHQWPNEALSLHILRWFNKYRLRKSELHKKHVFWGWHIRQWHRWLLIGIMVHKLCSNQNSQTLTGRCWHEETACRRCSHTAGRWWLLCPNKPSEQQSERSKRKEKY